MQNNSIPLRWIYAGGILFSLLFLGEKMAVNLVLFDLFILAALFLLYAEARQNAAVRWFALGHLTSLAMLVLHNTTLSAIACVVTLVLTVSYGLYLHRSPWFAGASGITNIILSPYVFLTRHVNRGEKKPRGKWSRVIRFAILPVVLLAFFYVIYSLGNNALSQFTEKMLERISVFFERFQWGQRLMMMVPGLLICTALLMKTASVYFSKKEETQVDEVERKRISWAVRSHNPLYNLAQTLMGKLLTGMMALKNENTIGLISLGLLNVLLLVVNIIDLDAIWLNYTPVKDVPVHEMVHEGTWVLIFSIIMAMVVVLFFFKGNLNFYKKNKWLKMGAYAWIIQNSFLVGSVFMRDLYYIQSYGLAYKRIGVLFFLLMVLIGLISVVVKVNKRKSIYYLLRVNAVASIIVLVLASAVHWDELIAGYNLSRRDKVTLDVPFLLSLSDKTIPLMEKNLDALKQYSLRDAEKLRQYTFYAPGSDDLYVQQLKDKEKQFAQKQAMYSWLSWNYADNYVKQYLTYLSTSH